MNLRSLLYLTLAISLFALMLLWVTLGTAFSKPQTPILSANKVKGMALESQGLHYTLNFSQQNEVVAAINHRRSLPIKDSWAPQPEKLIIFQFENEPLVIPLGSE